MYTYTQMYCVWSCLCMCVHVSISISLYVCVYTHISIYIYIYIYICTCISLRIPSRAQNEPRALNGSLIVQVCVLLFRHWRGHRKHHRAQDTRE